MRKDAPRVRKTESRDECVKCGSVDVVIPHGGHAALCRACFLANVNHKFRATVAKSQALRHGESVLLAYSGGNSSGAMLALVAEGIRQGTTKKLRFLPGAIIHVDESTALSGTGSDDEDVVATATRRQLVEALRRNIGKIFADGGDDHDDEVEESLGRDERRVPPLHVVPLENAMSIGEEMELEVEGMEEEEENQLKASKNHDAERKMAMDASGIRGVQDYESFIHEDRTRKNRLRLKAFLGKLKSTTSKIRAVQLLRRKIIAHVAQQLGYVHVMEGVSASRVAIDIMTDLALGRGTQIPKDVGLLDDRFQASERLTIVRPLREFSNKEIVVFNRLSKVPSFVAENMETGAAPLSSIQRATEHFILSLQADFSSTVSTVCKTGEKMAGNQLVRGNSSPEESVERCCLCSTVLDVTESPENEKALLRQITSPSLSAFDSGGGGGIIATAARALDVTTVISRASTTEESSEDVDKSGDLPLTVHEAISRSLCYSCRLISRESTLDEKSRTHPTTSKVDMTSNLTHPPSCLTHLSSELGNLPSFVVEKALQKQSRIELRNQIKDFLLDDT